ncbi:MAG: 6,7-dimethyl-8-ribityllumazine synthase [Rhodobiaceae bacterium]|jgi:6,7-dimethyl-8-ribityllumazine synthase|nr:6,7-dimethyl-8-ribityllumazine synthase [Rhodobiaceae bacterium]|tara:strand:- start:804 stop:1235 length:432 start_codon:yes stop_codon:yes gene_type:complete
MLKKRIIIIAAHYYKEITDMLVDGAKNYCHENDIDYLIYSVPGALEIPTAIKILNNRIKGETSIISGFVAIGCVIRGETSHYDIVSNESARGLTDLSLEHDIIIGNGILTVENKNQALERSTDKINKGYEAAHACRVLIDLNN